MQCHLPLLLGEQLDEYSRCLEDGRCWDARGLEREQYWLDEPIGRDPDERLADRCLGTGEVVAPVVRHRLDHLTRRARRARPHVKTSIAADRRLHEVHSRQHRLYAVESVDSSIAYRGLS